MIHSGSILIFVLPYIYINASFSILKMVLLQQRGNCQKSSVSKQKTNISKEIRSKFLSKPFWFLTISKQGENKTFITNLYYEKIKHKLWHRIIFHGYSNTLVSWLQKHLIFLVTVTPYFPGYSNTLVSWLQ